MAVPIAAYCAYANSTSTIEYIMDFNKTFSKGLRIFKPADIEYLLWRKRINFFLVRHATTNSLIEAGGVDFDRIVNEQGIAEALAMAVILKDYSFDKIFVSPAPRTKATARIICPSGEKIILDELYDEHPDLDTMFSLLRYSNLQAYYNHEKGDYMRKYGHAMAQLMANYLDALPDSDEERNILIVGHAVLLNALGAGLSKGKNLELCLNESLGAAACLLLSSDQQKSRVINPR